ncbi:hypothetical protein I0C86_03075 [Plantactinospora sp. S1510]|uniref:ApeA N-terminal domain-containing protein n=1 Tax=Plantactinospora alkalitolerans TaxID=2789879 RepID=A0ABS0GP72_9ACTN|nr:hypothetical protein [Plantactinospora alkalitolerans]MBF9127984.1 hypothetical protein [Plantactinospora alkalitolerans]
MRSWQEEIVRERQDEQERERRRAAAVDRLLAVAATTGMTLIRGRYGLTLRLEHGGQPFEVPLRDDHPELDSLTARVGPGLVVLGDYSAFAQIDQGYIEALVVGAGHAPEAGTPDAYHHWDSYRPGTIRAVAPDGGGQVELSPGSAAFWCLRGRFVETTMELGRDEPTYTTLKIRSHSPSTPDEAMKLLTLVAESWSFDLDGEYGLGFRLALRPSWPPPNYPRRRRGARPAAIEPTVDVPSRAYEAEALAFYWYARAMPRAPFVQFLAFYQVLEYHFTRYAHNLGVQEVATLLTRPGVDLQSMAFHSRVFDAIANVARSQRSELAQLRATIEATATAAGLKQRILSDPALKAHLHEKALTGAAPVRVNANSRPTSVVEAVAQRVYNLRCMVVHSKEGSNAQVLLLPQTPQFLDIERDLPLMRYLARAALTASSSPLAF